MTQEFEWFDPNEIIPDLYKEDTDDDEVLYFFYTSEPVLVKEEANGAVWYELARYKINDITHITKYSADWVSESNGMWITDNVKYWAYIDE